MLRRMERTDRSQRPTTAFALGVAGGRNSNEQKRRQTGHKQTMACLHNSGEGVTEENLDAASRRHSVYDDIVPASRHSSTIFPRAAQPTTKSSWSSC